MDFGSALMALLLFGVVKIAVMVMAAVLVVRLHRAGWSEPPRRLWLLLPEQDKPEIRVLWWSLVAFAFSELVCGVEVYILLHSSPIVATAHALSSALGMALLGLGLLLWFDRRVLRFGEPRCAMLKVCKVCSIHEPEGCRYRSVLVLVSVFAVLAVIPLLFAPTERMFADPRPWALPFESWNAWYDDAVVPWLIAHAPGYDPTGHAYSLPPTQLVMEFRVLPVLAGGLGGAALLLASRGREQACLKLLVMAAGVLAYCYFEAVLYVVTGDVLLGSFGHEVGEFWFLVAIAEFLRRSFPVEAPQVPIPEPAPTVS